MCIWKGQTTVSELGENYYIKNCTLYYIFICYCEFVPLRGFKLVGTKTPFPEKGLRKETDFLKHCQ